MIIRMNDKGKIMANLVLSGGGIKGLAYVGVFEEAEKRGYAWGNISGVSAGAMAGAYACAGYDAKQLKEIISSFDFGGLKLDQIAERVPAVDQLRSFIGRSETITPDIAKEFLKGFTEDGRGVDGSNFFSSDEVEGIEADPTRSLIGNMVKNAVLFGKSGCLFDGDHLEKWVSGVLAAKGIRTFGDLRGGQVSKSNPAGYRLRMTAVDVNRLRIIVLPDDMVYYGIKPDDLQVARAVRMSTAVPFAFKAVEIRKEEKGVSNTHYIVDGGVLDNFPVWLAGRQRDHLTMGFTLDSSNIQKSIHFNNPLGLLKSLLFVLHDSGKPLRHEKLKHVGSIDTAGISFLDFGLDENEKNILLNAGTAAAQKVFDNLNKLTMAGTSENMSLIERLFGICGRRY